MLYQGARKGFYMGTEPGQALTLICDYEKAKFYIVSLSMEGLSHVGVPADIDWALPERNLSAKL